MRIVLVNRARRPGPGFLIIEVPLFGAFFHPFVTWGVLKRGKAMLAGERSAEEFLADVMSDPTITVRGAEIDGRRY